MEELKEIEPVAKLFASVNDVSIREINLEEIGHEVRFIDVYTAEQLNQVIDYLEKKISKAGEFSNGSENLLFRGIKSAFRDTRKLIEEAQDEEDNL